MGTIGKLPFKKQALKDILLLVTKFINRFTSDRRIEHGVQNLKTSGGSSDM